MNDKGFGHRFHITESFVLILLLAWWLYAILAPFKNHQQREAYQDYISNYNP